MRELKVGDQVVIQHRTGVMGRGSQFSIHKITKKTATQITIDNGERYMLRTGERYGNGNRWTSGSCLATHWEPRTGSDYMTVEQAQDLIEQGKRKQDIFNKKLAIKNIAWKSANDNQITEMYNLAKKLGLIQGGSS